MVPLRRRALVAALKLTDIAILIAAYLIASAMVAWPIEAVSLQDFFSMRVKVRNAVLFAAMIGGCHLVLGALGLYESRRFDRRRKDMADVLIAALVCTAGLYVVSLLFQVKMIVGAFLPTFFLATSGLLAAERLLLRQALERVRLLGRNLRQVVLVGTNRRALGFARMAEARPELGCRVLGFVDDLGWDPAREFEGTSYPLLARLDGLPELLRTRPVDEVIVFLPFGSLYRRNDEIVRQCEAQGIPVTFPHNLFDVGQAPNPAVAASGGDGLLTYARSTIGGLPALAKRALDVTCAGVLLAVLAPLLLGVALLVRLTSPGPIIFVQERIGRNKRPFRMYKFRTMVIDAERRLQELAHLNEASGPVFKIRKDPRLTPAGAFLRRASLDELPQLLNVLRGDLSLVGPRPLPPRDYQGFDDDRHRRRFSVKPGITCLWQISGRSQLSFDRWMELDLEYIDTWSFWLDLKILAKTVPAVLRGTGAV